MKTELGACCICNGTRRVRNMIMLEQKAPMAGRGWGCLVCGLSSDGALAVLCDPCLKKYREGQKLAFACKGYPALDGRIQINHLTGRHAHDLRKHQEL